MNTNMTFSTERLNLRPVSENDAEFIYTLLNSEAWKKYIGDRNVNSLDEAKKYIQVRMLPQLNSHGYGNYMLIRKKDNVKIGTCGLYDREGLEGVDLGYALLEEFWHNGYAYEAASTMTMQGFEMYDLPKICAITSKENTASQKLLRKLHFEYTDEMCLPEDDEVLNLFTLTKERFLDIQSKNH